MTKATSETKYDKVFEAVLRCHGPYLAARDLDVQTGSFGEGGLHPATRNNLRSFKKLSSASRKVLTEGYRSRVPAPPTYEQRLDRRRAYDPEYDALRQVLLWDPIGGDYTTTICDVEPGESLLMPGGWENASPLTRRAQVPLGLPSLGSVVGALRDLALFCRRSHPVPEGERGLPQLKDHTRSFRRVLAGEPYLWKSLASSSADIFKVESLSPDECLLFPDLPENFGRLFLWETWGMGEEVPSRARYGLFCWGRVFHLKIEG